MVLVANSLELWGGIECTVNRVRDQYFDQLEASGHARRPQDLSLIADLGISALRYPLLWERALCADGSLDFRWAAERFGRLRELGVQPIAGLVHHGSGPKHTSLLDASFSEQLAGYAGSVARQFPWIERYTPVNEPLTTARFSALYGHWYPHERDDRAFVRALLVQCRAVVLAMRAIREVNSSAQLVQTEDMGYTRSTPELAYQADFENERRWLSFDLLSGRVDRQHPLYDYVRSSGVSEHELGFFREQPCPPDIIGLNYYVTSERFLDGRTHLYLPQQVGGNRFHPYADVEAVRVCADGLLGPGALLKQAATRYERPVAITEAHLGCSVDQRIAWFDYVRHEALAARSSGADVRAVTAWALLGAYDWHCLVTRCEGVYEAGAFEIINGEPHETEFGAFLRGLARGTSTAPQVCQGWWSSPERILYEPHPAAHAPASGIRRANEAAAQLLTGSSAA
ncbi:MAG: family 1 glycosylhydrolase [Myxococcota bacterium]